MFSDDHWLPALDQGSMLKYDWKVKEEKNLVIDFNSGTVILATYSGGEKRSLKQATVTEHFVSFELEDIGCVECGGGEIWNFVLERNISGKLRLNIVSYAQCTCQCLASDDEERCEERDYLAYRYVKPDTSASDIVART